MGCDDHRPLQHRDGKEPWCPKCGLTGDYRQPTQIYGQLTPDPYPEEMPLFIDIAHAESIHEAIAYALGAASVCWDPRPEGVFQSDLASKIGDALLERIEKGDNNSEEDQS